MQRPHSHGSKRNLEEKYNDSLLEQAGRPPKITKEPGLRAPPHDISGR
jgi:hypothetical protein